jgi:hypothetical protein
MHPLATTPKQCPHTSVPIARMPAGQLGDLGGQRRIALRAGLVAECRARQLQQDTGSALREPPGNQEVGRPRGGPPPLRFFCQSRLQRIDFPVALGQQPLEAGILLLQLT